MQEYKHTIKDDAKNELSNTSRIFVECIKATGRQETRHGYFWILPISQYY